MWTHRKWNLSVLAILVIGLFWSFQIGAQKRWESGQVLVSDSKAYYAYLPAIVLNGDNTFAYVRDLPKEKQGQIWYSWTADGKPYIKMAVGTAICQAPAFLIAHIIALAGDWQPNGYSSPYYLAILLNALLFAIWSLFLIKSILRRWFDDHVSAIVLLLFAFATNLSFYVTWHASYSHVYSFWAVAAFIYSTLKWYDSPKWRTTIQIGLLAGLLVLIRPTNILMLAFFPLWGLLNKENMNMRWQLFLKEHQKLLVITLLALLVFSVQLFYWKWSVDRWWFYSYGDEGFFWGNPHLLEVLFSYRKGWLLYTPVMILSIVGLLFLYRRVPKAKWAIPLLFLLHLYIISSWQAWWYGDSFSQRGMVDIYPLLALPLAALIQVVTTKKRWPVAALVGVFALGCVWLNTIQSQQYKDGIIHWDGMTKEAYAATWMQDKFPPGYDHLIVRPDIQRSLRGAEEYISSVASFSQTSKHLNPVNEVIDKSENYTKVISIPLENIAPPDKRVRARCEAHLQVDSHAGHEQFSFWVTPMTQKPGLSKRFDAWAGEIRTDSITVMSHTIDLWPPYAATDSLKLNVEYRFGPPVDVKAINVFIEEASFPE